MKAEDLSLDEEIEATEARVSLEREGELADLRTVLESSQGQRVLRRILAFCGLFRLSYTRNADTYFREGQRKVGLWLFNEIVEASQNTDNLAWLLKQTAMETSLEEKNNGSRER